MAALYTGLVRLRAQVEPFLQCPVSREALAPEQAWLASDGHLYARESLEELAAHAARARMPLRSPVTREVLRPWAVCAAPRLVRFGFAVADTFASSGSTSRGLLRLGDSLPWGRPPFPPHVEVMRGTRLVESWADAFGAACRVALGWQDGDVAEWCFPVEELSILTPPPAEELRPLARHLARWLRLHGSVRNKATFSNPDHVLTGWVRIRRPALEGEACEAAAEWRTFEELFLELNRAGR
jgi:hypothetical protein